MKFLFAGLGEAFFFETLICTVLFIPHLLTSCIAGSRNYLIVSSFHVSLDWEPFLYLGVSGLPICLLRGLASYLLLRVLSLHFLDLFGMPIFITFAPLYGFHDDDDGELQQGTQIVLLFPFSLLLSSLIHLVLDIFSSFNFFSLFPYVLLSFCRLR